MESIRHILFPVDFSKSCEAVRSEVTSIAERLGARITVLHVTEIYAAVDLGFPMPADLETMRQKDRLTLEKFCEPFRSLKPASVCPVAVIGDPATVITEFAEKHDVDLIMMPTRGRGRLRSLLLGSVTAKVLHDSSCAVWTTARTSDEALPHTTVKSILCALDLTADAPDLIRRAVELGKMFDATVRLVHAVPGAQPAGFGDVSGNFGRFLIDSSREELVRVQNELGTNLEARFEAKSVSAGVCQSALDCEADLVIIGRGRLDQVLGRLRTNAYAIIRDSPCPVISL